MKKSVLVRGIIAGAKASGLSAADIIDAVMADTGFARQLARTYINNNWEKVTASTAVAVAVEAATEAAGAAPTEVPEVAPTEAVVEVDAAAAKREAANARKRAARAAAKAVAVVVEDIA